MEKLKAQEEKKLVKKLKKEKKKKEKKSKKSKKQKGRDSEAERSEEELVDPEAEELFRYFEARFILKLCYNSG